MEAPGYFTEGRDAFVQMGRSTAPRDNSLENTILADIVFLAPRCLLKLLEDSCVQDKTMRTSLQLLLLAILLPICAAPTCAWPVTLPDLHGVSRTIPAAQARATVLVFIAHDCPIANGYAPEIQRIAALYAPRGVVFDLVYVEPALTAAAARAHEAAYRYHLTALRDTKHLLVKMSGATVTPEAVVLTPHGKIAYRGRIDNKFPALGVQRTIVTRHDLCIALNDVLAGKPVAKPITTAIGCFIPPLD